MIFNGSHLKPQLITLKSEVNKIVQIIKSMVSNISEVKAAPMLNSVLDI